MWKERRAVDGIKCHQVSVDKVPRKGDLPADPPASQWQEKRQAGSSMREPAAVLSSEVSAKKTQTKQQNQKTHNFFSSSHLVCFRHDTVINVELSACLKMVLHLLLLSPWATKAAVCFSIWKGTWESLWAVQKGARRGCEWGAWPWLAQLLTQIFLLRNLLQLWSASSGSRMLMGTCLPVARQWAFPGSWVSSSSHSLPHCTLKTRRFLSRVT